MSNRNQVYLAQEEEEDIEEPSFPTLQQEVPTQEVAKKLNESPDQSSDYYTQQENSTRAAIDLLTEKSNHEMTHNYSGDIINAESNLQSPSKRPDLSSKGDESLLSQRQNRFDYEYQAQLTSKIKESPSQLRNQLLEKYEREFAKAGSYLESKTYRIQQSYNSNQSAPLEGINTVQIENKNA